MPASGFLKAGSRRRVRLEHGWQRQDLLRAGVRLSFEQWGVAGVDEYLAGTTLPESYTDPNGGATSYSTQLSQLGVAWNDGASKEEMQERIIIQKWIANFHLGNEAWADFRRTGFPHLIPAMESAVGNNSQASGTLRSAPVACPILRTRRPTTRRTTPKPWRCLVAPTTWRPACGGTAIRPSNNRTRRLTH